MFQELNEVKNILEVIFFYNFRYIPRERVRRGEDDRAGNPPRQPAIVALWSASHSAPGRAESLYAIL